MLPFMNIVLILAIPLTVFLIGYAILKTWRMEQERFVQNPSIKWRIVLFHGDEDGPVAREFSRLSLSNESAGNMVKFESSIHATTDIPMPERLPALVATADSTEKMRAEGLTTAAEVEAFVDKVFAEGMKAVFRQ
jgi:hypothetical protein